MLGAWNAMRITVMPTSWFDAQKPRGELRVAIEDRVALATKEPFINLWSGSARVRRHDRRHPGQDASAEDLPLGCQATALVIGQSEPAAHELLLRSRTDSFTRIARV